MQLRLYVYTRARAASVNDVTRLFESLFFFFFLTGTSSGSFRFEISKYK